MMQICYLFSLSFFSLFSLRFSFSAVPLLLLKGLEQKVAEVMHSILNDDKQGEWVALYRTTLLGDKVGKISSW